MEPGFGDGSSRSSEVTPAVISFVEGDPDYVAPSAEIANALKKPHKNVKLPVHSALNEDKDVAEYGQPRPYVAQEAPATMARGISTVTQDAQEQHPSIDDTQEGFPSVEALNEMTQAYRNGTHEADSWKSDEGK